LPEVLLSAGHAFLHVSRLRAGRPPQNSQEGASAIPQVLKDKGIKGDVRLKVFVKQDGSVRVTELLGGNPILAESAQKSVSQWKFAPGNSELTVEIVVHFDLAAN